MSRLLWLPAGQRAAIRKLASVVALFLALALVIPAGANAFPGFGNTERFQNLWDALRSLDIFAMVTTEKADACIDPDGVPCAPAATSEHGGLIDPDGAPAPPPDTSSGTGAPDGAPGD